MQESRETMFTTKTHGSLTVFILVLSVASGFGADKKETKKGICVDAKDDMKVVCAIAAKKEAAKKIADANKVLMSQATPEEKSAMKEVAKAEKNQREAQQKMIMAFTQADVEGCENPQSVGIVPFPWSSWNFRYIPFPYVVVRINNKSGETISHIDSSENGVRVRNLCQNGSVSTFRPHISGVDGETVTFTLTAWGMNGGSVNSPTFTLSVYQPSANQSFVWDIPHLQK